ncbi:serine/threonine-protein kinase [Polyangium sp. y55x31]|uniref:serine/threonine-protein kinase n=1 Tax=Polyangium sp. y55x31 TaxID=3042688 RepID=UPI00248271C0|nr:serine/threonine-protein kinase [Polyangium sp. y55x31]MDI1476490.1 protein kinase [Polyangium sp. y55x31]
MTLGTGCWYARLRWRFLCPILPPEPAEQAGRRCETEKASSMVAWLNPGVPDHPFQGTDRFRPIELIGRGGMGSVYRVHDVEMGRDVALKTLEYLDSNLLYYLKEEFRSLAGITHPNLVELYELVAQGEDCFFTMELLDGVHFIEHVRGPQGCAPLLTEPRSRMRLALVDGSEVPCREEDTSEGLPPAALERLSRTLPQLVHGLAALHAGGKIHRDIKPSNVVVTREGRLVILDFGLTIPYRQGSQWPPDREVVGTLPYMAPEQMRGGRLSPAADWYSVGVMLYEALTGSLPFTGSVPDVLRHKQQAYVRPPREFAPATPPALDALVMALLHPDPARRAGGDTILKALGSSPSELSEAVPPAKEAPFVGRAEELAALRAAFEDVKSGHAVLVRVEGASGMGKTELVQRFLSSLIETELDLVAFRGRCHPQESVPYKAFDSLVDELSRYLVSLHPYHLDAIAPAHGAALTRLFPVLGRVPALATSRGHAASAQDPQELRQRGFEAMRELAANIALFRLLVFWIDDLQWGDADSGLLLRELLRPEDAPPMLVILSYRSEDVDRSPILEAVASMARELPEGAARRIVLSPLDEGCSRALFSMVLASEGSAFEPLAARMAVESAGSPFFIGELARHLRAAPGAALDLHLSRVIQARVEQLTRRERCLLEIVSVAGGPIDRGVALRASGLGETGRPDAARLGQLSLLRFTELNGKLAVETYHDRIREALVADLPAEELRTCHRRLAEALLSLPSPDPEALVEHYLGAGDARAASHYALLAADRAAASLAFDRAAALYRKALTLDTHGEERWKVERKLGETLTNAGRGGEAAEAFMAAAATRAAQAHDDMQILTLERCAAEQYLHSGRIHEGMSLLRSVLVRVGVRLPDSSRRAFWSALFVRQRLLAQGVRVKRRSPDQVSAQALARLDTLWGVSTSLALINFTTADALGVKQLSAALKLGERSRMARALGYEASVEACFRWPLLRWHSERLLCLAEDLARETGDPYDRAWALASRAACSWFAASWAASVRFCDESAALLRERCQGIAWELAMLDAFALSALAQLGRVRELGERLARSMRDAERRGDLFAMSSCRLGQPSLSWLAADRAEEYDASLRTEDVELEWRLNPTQQYHRVISVVQTCLYMGEAERAWAYIEDAWPHLRGSKLLWVECIRVELCHLRARAALAAAACGPVHALRSREARLVRTALTEARRIERTALPHAAPLAALIRAAAARLGGDRDRAARALSAAVEGFARTEMALYREAARARLGALRGGAEGLALIEESRRFMAAEGIREPAAMIAMLAPG